MKKVLSIDLGGQSAKCAIIREDGLITNKFTIKTELDDVLGYLKSEIFSYFKENDLNFDDIAGIGFGTPGFVHEGVVVLSGNLKWKNFELKEQLQKIFNKTVTVNNDANAAALGEFWIGSGKEYSDIIFYIIGTGVGGGIITNNKLVEGSSGFAGELGHGGNFQDKYSCSCGLKNCIEPLSSAKGMEKIINEFAKVHKESTLGKMRYAKGTDLTLIDIAPKIKSNEKEVVDLITFAIEPLAKHISTMIFALNPQAIIIGGGPSNIGAPYIKIIEKEVEKYMLEFMSKTFCIKTGVLKNDAGIYGNAYAILKRLDLI